MLLVCSSLRRGDFSLSTIDLSSHYILFRYSAVVLHADFSGANEVNVT